MDQKELLFRSYDVVMSRFTFSSVLVFINLIGCASSRDYKFPMCPPTEWEIPGGKISTSGKVLYQLVCDPGYTQPMLANRSETFVCSDSRKDALPRRCVPIIYAPVVLEYGMSIKTQRGSDGIKDVCTDRVVLTSLRKFRFKPVIHFHVETQHFDDNDLDDIRVKVNSCENINPSVSLVVVHMTQVHRANGTIPIIHDYYNFISVETFKQLKAAISRRGYEFTSVIELDEPEEKDVAEIAIELEKEQEEGDGKVGNVEDNLMDWLATTINGSYTDKTKTNFEGEEKSNATNSPKDEEGLEPTSNGVIDSKSEDLSDVNKNSLNSAGGDLTLSRDKRSASKEKPKDKEKKSSTEENSYVGFYKTHKDGHGNVGYSCPPHLFLRKDRHNHLCVGCGKGWVMHKLPGTKEQACYPCGPGFYNDLDTATTCKPCPLKYASAPWDAASIDECFQVHLTSDEKRMWKLFGYLQPIVYFLVICIIVAWVSKVSAGTSSYKTSTSAAPRKSIIKITEQDMSIVQPLAQ